MNWMTIAWPMVTSACITMALINLRVALGDGRRAQHIYFFFSAIAVACISILELALLRETDLGRYQTMLRWASAPIFVMVTMVTGFVWTFFGTGQKWLALTGIGLNALCEIANLVTAEPGIRHAVSIQQIEMFGGVRFSLAKIEIGPWNFIEIASVVFAMIFVLDASLALWKRGERRRALIVGGGILFFFLLSRGHAALLETGMIQTPYLVSFSFLCVVIAMGHELGHDVMRAAQLARDLQESQRRMDLAASAAALGLWNWDFVRDEIWASEGARALFEIPAKEPLNIGRFFESVHPDDREPVQLALKTAVNGGIDYEKEYRVLLSGGRVRWIAARGKVEMSAGRLQLMRGVLLDITAERQSQTELQQLRSQLAHAGRVSLMGQLASALAHELSQPLGAILRNAEAAEIFLRSDTPDLEELRCIIVDICKDDRRAGEVIDRLRSLLKRRNLDAHTLDLSEVVHDVISLVRSDAASRQVKFCIDIPPQMPSLQGDRVHLQQVLLNLILNGMDAMNDTPAEMRSLTLRANHDGPGRVRLSVIDTGSGIPPERLNQVFDPFFTTKPHGMGMGLPISRTIAEAHGGRLWAANNPEGGTIFFLTLPVALGESGS